MTQSLSELIFFDTFSHEADADVNLDLVQFPKPVFISHIRIIPLGARVQADFPGGVRLGATNPSKFDIEFFVNDLGMPGASTFENLGQLKYNQNDCIHLECTQDKIPTDGLVLRGWYSTITLAVYGFLTNTVNEPITSPPLHHDSAGPEIVASLNEKRIVKNNNKSTTQDNANKTDWKEPLRTGQMPVHIPNPIPSVFESRDVEENFQREYYRPPITETGNSNVVHQMPPERTTPCNRTHSESNERDVLRSSSAHVDKIPGSHRRWSRSPENGSHSRRKYSDRSHSETDEPQKWPRTPPSLSYSTANRHSSPTKSQYNNNNEQPDVPPKPYPNINNKPSSSTDTAVKEPSDDSLDQQVQYEPILSDDEIIGKEIDIKPSNTPSLPETMADPESDLDLPLQLEFDPANNRLGKFEIGLHSCYIDELDNIRLIFKKFTQQHHSINSVQKFIDATTATVGEREHFVHLCEQLINHFSYLAQHFRQRNLVMHQLFYQNDEHKECAYKILEIALDIECACSQIQPAFKIRHIKSGTKLVELMLAASKDLLDYVLSVKKFNPFDVLLMLYSHDFMSLSIKIMLLKAVCALLDIRSGLTYFLEAKVNGYQLIAEMLQHSSMVRTKYALQTIVKKMHVYEALDSIREYCSAIFILEPKMLTTTTFCEKFQLIEYAIDVVIDTLVPRNAALSYQQSKHFLPVSKKFEIAEDAAAQRSFSNTLQSYFRQHGLAESLLLLFSNANEISSSLLMRSVHLLKALMQTVVGIDYLIDDCFETTQMIVFVLMGVNEVVAVQDIIKGPDSDDTNINNTTLQSGKIKTEADDTNCDDTTMKAASFDERIQTNLNATINESTLKPIKFLHTVGSELAYKVQTRYHLDAIITMSKSNSYDSIGLASHLHALYLQTCQASGGRYTVDIISRNNNIQVFFDLIRKEQRLQTQRQKGSGFSGVSGAGGKCKTPVLSYAVDMIDYCVRFSECLDYLIDQGQEILELTKHHGDFEPSVSTIIHDMAVYLKPLEVVDIFCYNNNNIALLVGVINSSLDFNTTQSGDIIMCMRILRYWIVGHDYHCTDSSRDHFDNMELKYRFVVLQFFAADGIQVLIHILERICSYFDQPGLHTAALMSMHGMNCCQIILPTLQILWETLTYAIQCRDIEFKDLTAIDCLMKTYNVLHFFPKESHVAIDVELAKRQIIQILLAYTQPHEHDAESLHESLWTQMVSEVFKNIDAPSTFIPGLHVLTELLPLPLPIPLFDSNIEAAQCQRLINDRKLWSAHLHPQRLQIVKLIETIAPATLPQLRDLMLQVCLQLADLAPNMTLLISKTLSDMLHTEWSVSKSIPTSRLSHLLAFFWRMTVYTPFKSSVLSILSGTLWDLFQTVLSIDSSNSSLTEITLNCQVSVHRIVENCIDSNVSFISKDTSRAPELKLASSLPPKELISPIVNAVLGNLVAADPLHLVGTLALRNILIILKYDITVFHLISSLKSQKEPLRQWLHKIIELPNVANTKMFVSMMELLDSLVHIPEKPIENEETNVLPERTVKMTINELSNLIGLPFVERLQSVSDNYCNLEEANADVILRLTTLLAALEANNTQGIINVDTEHESQLMVEPTLPQTESIVTQYETRPIFTIVNTDKECILQLKGPYRSDVMNSDMAVSKDNEQQQQYEHVICDLNELANSCLPIDTNLTTDCKRVFHLSASPQSSRERKKTTPCFRTQRVKVEPSTGRPEKNIYVTPVRSRGFARSMASRSDVFRSRPPNTSRPPSLHVDDFQALETCGVQPTGPTGYNKIPAIMRGPRSNRSRGSRLSTISSYRKTKPLQTASPTMWNEDSPQYRHAGTEAHFSCESHYSTSHFSGRMRSRGSRSRSYLRGMH